MLLLLFQRHKRRTVTNVITDRRLLMKCLWAGRGGSFYKHQQLGEKEKKEREGEKEGVIDGRTELVPIFVDK